MARELNRHFEPSCVVGFGGYVATPAYFAARRRKVPIVVHEANVRPGLANRIGAPVATTLKAKGLFNGAPFDLGVCGTLVTPAASLNCPLCP